MSAGPGIESFAGRFLHDLAAASRALRALRGFVAEDLADAGVPLPPDTARMLRLMGERAATLEALVAGVTEYRAVGTESPALVEPREVLASVMAAPGLSGARVEADVHPATLRIPRADLARLFRVPLENAVRFHPDRTPRVTLRAGPDGQGGWRMTVDDDGPGIAPEHRAKAMEPLGRLTAAGGGGSGMGLAILARAAACHGGAATLGASSTGGLRVEVVLPLT
ncbi:hypothetical protein HKCCE2091_04970 [Rhodobacterales bacterium HKCCE2091]|nr:hypothetical protein [Rhodobacterales bacterium HKCCE2091]